MPLNYALLSLTLFISAHLPAQENTFFNKPVEIGSYYYPEHWPESDWSNDLRRMSAMGFTFTHFGEFAWSQLEPTEGNYQFKWLDEAISLAADNGLKVILCTPSPTPPAWLSQKHPEILVVNDEGRTMQHGSRQHASWSSEVYRSYVAKIVTQLAQRYGNDKRVWGWQLDNEPSHYSTFYDYSPVAQEAFRLFLKNKYKTIDTLNIIWGNAFWSQTYSNFDQIIIPNAKQLVQPPNPHALLDFQHFNNQEMTDFLAAQSRILRETISPSQFITTNYMVALPHIDPFPGKENFDFASYTNYPVNSYDETDKGELGFRLGSAYGLILSHEFCKSVNGYTGIMELQPGQVNWGQYNSQPLPGAIRMWIWHTFAMGSRFVCNYRFRQPTYGNEQYHQGMIMPDGQTISNGGKEYNQAINELQSIEKHLNSKVAIPSNLIKGKTAIIWDRPSVMDIHNFPHTQQWNSMSPLKDFHKALKSMALPTEFITADQILNPIDYPFVIAPSIQLTDESMIKNWTNYVKQGGHLILTCRTGQKDRNGHLWRGETQGPIQELTGLQFVLNDQLPPNRPQSVTFQNQSFDWHIYSEVVKVLNKDVQTWATHNDSFYKGQPTATHRRIGNGSVTYIGTRSADLEKAILNKLYISKGVNPDELPDYVFKEFRDGLWIMVNYTSEIFQTSIPSTSTILLGSCAIQPGGVLVWKP